MLKKEILKINAKLKKPFKDVSFFEEDHKYVIKGQEDKPIKSVSSLLKYFYEEFNTTMMAKKYGDSRGLDPDDVLKAWSGEGVISTTHGTKVHLFGENYVKWKWFEEIEEPEVFDKQSLGVKQFLEDLPPYIIPVATELVMYSPTYWYTGTCDLLMYNTKKDVFIMGDYKTNKKIEGDKYSTKKLKHVGEKYDLDSSNLSKYSLQFSFYQIMLEDAGFNLSTRVLIHLTDDTENKKLYKTYRTKDLTPDLRKWLEKKEHLVV